MITSISHLKYPPLKKNKTIITNQWIFLKKKSQDAYKAILVDIKKPRMYSYMSFYKKDCFQPNDNLPSLYVVLLYSNPRKNGLGENLLTFAKNFSKQIGCEGRVSLLADPSIYPKEVSHIFYKKNGMNTGNLDVDAKLDKFIKKRKVATQDDFSDIRMYYPPIEYDKACVESYNNSKKSVFTKLKNFINKYFKI